jgi:amino acid transporter
MSLRDAINLRRRKSGIIMMAGFTLFALGGMASSANRSFIALSLLGFLMFGGGILYQFFGIRCPRCGGKIGFALNSFGNLFAVPSQFRFCPLCGVALDTQLDATQQT